MKRGIVVGASSGLGREVALLLLERGWTLGVAARRVEALDEIESSYPGRVTVGRIDVTEEGSAADFLELVERVGGMELLFYASGVGKQNRTLEPSIELTTVSTNGMGFVRIVGAAYRYMSQCGGGHIACITSIAGTKGLGPAPSYSATKAMQSTYLQALEQQARSRKLDIVFTDIRPGFVDTALLADGNKYPMVLSPTPVARAMVRAVERRRHVVVIDWRWRVVTRLWRWLPRCLWRRMRL